SLMSDCGRLDGFSTFLEGNMTSSSTQRSIHPGAATLLMSVIVWLAALSISACADAVTDWDVIAFDAVDASGKTGPATSCTIAMAHVAMHDALNAIDRRYEPYAYDAAAPRDASPEAAVATAAYGILIVKLPNQKTTLDAALASALAAIPDGKAKADGVAGWGKGPGARFPRGAQEGAEISISLTPRARAGGCGPTPP